jgi:hypothetical protein
MQVVNKGSVVFSLVPVEPAGEQYGEKGQCRYVFLPTLARRPSSPHFIYVKDWGSSGYWFVGK